jgi:hypothetical protein
MLDTDLKTGDTIESVDLESVDKKNQKTFIECVESVTLEILIFYLFSLVFLPT